MSLESFVKAKIAALNGVTLAEVDADFIQQKRSDLLADPTHRVIDDVSGLPCPTMAEREKDQSEAEAFFDQFEAERDNN